MIPPGGAGDLIREAFPRADLHDSKAGKVAILRAEGTVQYIDFLNEFRGQRLERAQIALAVALACLILWQVINNDLQPAVDTAVVKVEAETSNFEGLAATFVLARIDPPIECFKDLVVPLEEGLAVDLIVSPIDARIKCR